VAADDDPDRSAPALIGLLRGRLRSLHALVEQRGETALRGTGLSLPLDHLLDAVVASPGITVTEIARPLRKTQQAISLAADRLEQLGLIERRVGTGRSVGLHPTATGKSASAEGVRRELENEARLRAIIGPKRFDELGRLLDDALRALLEDEQRPT
jgi:DNA-binding MarR family transcriptional regulator